MTTYDHTVGGSAAAIPAEGLNQFYRKQGVLDFDSSNTNGVNRTSGDVLQLIDVGADEFVLIVGLEVLTAEGGTLTVDVGDGGDPDCFLDGVDGNVTAGTMYASYQTYTAPSTTNADVDAVFSTKGIASVIGGRQYTAADTIDVIPKNDVDAAKLRVTTFSFNLGGNQTVANAVVT